MTDEKKFRRRARERAARTGESYTTAKRNLERGVPEPMAPTAVQATGHASSIESGAAPESRRRPSDDTYREGRREFRAKSLGDWRGMVVALAAGAARVEWTDPLRIVEVLNRIRRDAPNNHVHFPTHGGLDLHGASPSGSDLPDPRRNDRGFDDRIVTETSAPAVA